MIRQNLEKQIKDSTGQVQKLYRQAYKEGGRDVAARFSGRLDRMATHAVNNGLSAAEIVELLRQESELINNKGGALWQ
ncbi:DUF2732 family protein [Mixta sp. Marseille-Q2057]|nr:DUF2732 family protein [Mixta mediterraneensis]